jgi:hypothetical protein
MAPPLPAGLRATLGVAALVEAYAGLSLVLTPARFIRATYGTRGALDPMTLKFARCVRCPLLTRTQLRRLQPP